MKISARNVLKGTVVKMQPGAVNTEVTLKVAEGLEIVSIISKASVERLRLEVGSQAYAVIKASSVLIAADD